MLSWLTSIGRAAIRGWRALDGPWLAKLGGLGTLIWFGPILFGAVRWAVVEGFDFLTVAVLVVGIVGLVVQAIRHRRSTHHAVYLTDEVPVTDEADLRNPRQIRHAIAALDQQRQYGQELHNEIMGTPPPAPLHKFGPQRFTALIRMGSNPSDPAGRVQQWIYETMAVVDHHTHAEIGRFLNEVGFPDAGTNDPAKKLEHRLLRLEEIISDQRARDQS